MLFIKDRVWFILDKIVDCPANLISLCILEVMLLDCLNAVAGKFSDG